MKSLLVFYLLRFYVYLKTIGWSFVLLYKMVGVSLFFGMQVSFVTVYIWNVLDCFWGISDPFFWVFVEYLNFENDHKTRFTVYSFDLVSTLIWTVSMHSVFYAFFFFTVQSELMYVDSSWYIQHYKNIRLRKPW